MIWRVMRFINPRVMNVYKSSIRAGGLVLILTTTGRKTGQPHITPLQYEEVGDLIYVGVARGQQADWFQNIVANPNVEVRIDDYQFHTVAETITDPTRIADFLAIRLERHPIMLRVMLILHGLSPFPNRGILEKLGSKLALVVIQPEG